MHAHRKAISESLNSVRSMNNAIKAHIIASLKTSANEDDFAPEWISNSLQQCEQMWLDKQLPYSASPSQLQLPGLPAVIREENNLDERQLRVIIHSFRHRTAISSSRTEPVTQHLFRLYTLLNHSNTVYEILSHLDLLMSQGSWGCVLAGLIDFAEVSRLLKSHAIECQETLVIPHDLVVILNRPAGKGLIKYDLVSVDKLQELIMYSAVDLHSLSEPSLQAQISRMVG